MLSISLIKRMRLDLTSLVDDGDGSITLEDAGDARLAVKPSASKRWIAHPKTLRLSTRPRPSLNPDGTRQRNFTRVSKSSSMPSLVLSLTQDIVVLAGNLVEEALLPLFRKLHPQKSGWNLSLVNICATNMSMTAACGKTGAGRDIGRMLRRQEDVLKDWKIADVDVAPSNDKPDDCRIEPDVRHFKSDISSHSPLDAAGTAPEDALPISQRDSFSNEVWDSEGEENYRGEMCKDCGATLPSFAMVAHERFHYLPG